jgi:hypothetical protein
VNGVLALCLVAAASTCEATTNIAAFKDRIEAACGPGIQAVDLHEYDAGRISYTITYAADQRGERVKGTVLYIAAKVAALQVRDILAGVYPFSTLAFALRDGGGRLLCRFHFEAGQLDAVRYHCADVVGEAEEAES